MNEFMNALYNAVGCEVSGFYDGVPFLGTITETRVKYGNDIRVFKNLHVYFK